MKRTTVMLEEETYERLKVLARRRGVTAAAMLREAVHQYVVESEDADEGPLEGIIGILDGPAEDLGARTSEIAREAATVKHRCGASASDNR